MAKAKIHYFHEKSYILDLKNKSSALSNEKVGRVKIISWVTLAEHRSTRELKYLERAGEPKQRRQNRKLTPGQNPNQKPEPCVHGDQLSRAGKLKGKTLQGSRAWASVTRHNIKKSFRFGQKLNSMLAAVSFATGVHGICIHLTAFPRFTASVSHSPTFPPPHLAQCVKSTLKKMDFFHQGLVFENF